MDYKRSASPAAMAELGEWIEQLRRHQGLSIREAARQAGFSEGLWRQLEKGGRRVYEQWVPASPRDENLFAVALVLGVDPEEIFGRAGREVDTNYDALFARLLESGAPVTSRFGGRRHQDLEDDEAVIAAAEQRAGRRLSSQERRQVLSVLDAIIATTDE